MPKSGWQRAKRHSQPQEDKLSICKGTLQIVYASTEMERLRLTTVRYRFLLLAWAGLRHRLHLHLPAAAAVVVFPIASAVHSHSESKFKLLDRCSGTAASGLWPATAGFPVPQPAGLFIGFPGAKACKPPRARTDSFWTQPGPGSEGITRLSICSQMLFFRHNIHFWP